MAETPHRGGLVGELMHHGFVEQFEALRDGDRFWYERHLEPDELAEVRSLAGLLRGVTGLGAELSNNPLVVDP